MRFLTVLLLVSGLGASSQSSNSEGAVVTFYATGGTVRLSPAMGFIFDGKEMIGEITPGHFMAVNIPAGAHVFTASMSKAGDDREPIELSITPGKQYFFRVTTTHKMGFGASSYQSHLQATTCEKARSDADTTKPVEAKRVESAWRPSLSNLAYFPKC